MKNGFYRAFEDRYRGSRELIKGRLRAYLPLIGYLHSFHPVVSAVDLGCGRGEWLELLGETGFASQGVDIDESMLQACRERGLKVSSGDALAFLRSLPDESQCIVSGFHIVEHIAFDDVRRLNEEAMRVLKPGGLLILETPNPENLLVGCSWFYRDPSHLRPIPTELLAFVAEFAGFARVKVVRLNESAGLLDAASPDLLSVLAGASPDYSVVAQKTGDAAILEASAPGFARAFGITFDQLATRFQSALSDQLRQLDGRAAEALEHAALAGSVAASATACADRAEARVSQVEARAIQAEERAILSEQLAAASEARATRAESAAALAEACAARAESLAAQALDRTVRAEGVVVALLTSTSWRVTAPLRWLGNKLKRVRAAVGGLRPAILLRRCAAYAACRPRLKRSLLLVLDRLPALKARLMRVITPPLSAEISQHSTKDTTSEASLSNAHAKRIHAGLQSAIRRRRKGC